jgi:hypothetical protein
MVGQAVPSTNQTIQVHAPQEQLPQRSVIKFVTLCSCLSGDHKGCPIETPDLFPQELGLEKLTYKCNCICHPQDPGQPRA